MNTLEIVQTLHKECKLPGAAPTTIVGQTGRAADLVRWTIEGWNDIQREKDGKWLWLRRDFTLDTVNGTAAYAYGSCTDVDAAVAIARFRAWDLDDRERPLIYLVSATKSTEGELAILPYAQFRGLYLRGVHDSAYPAAITARADNKLVLGPTPNAVYRVTGNYWRSNQTLALDADIPECPTDYHMGIVYRAITKFGFVQVSSDVLQRAKFEGGAIHEALVLNQSYARRSFSVAGPLA